MWFFTVLKLEPTVLAQVLAVLALGLTILALTVLTQYWSLFVCTSPFRVTFVASIAWILFILSELIIQLFQKNPFLKKWQINISN